MKTEIAVRAELVFNQDAIDVWVLRYNRPEEGHWFTEVLTGDRGWVRCDGARQLLAATLRIDGRTLGYDKPLDVALRSLTGAERDWRQRIEQVVEGAVMRALAGSPAWFPIYERSDGRLMIDVTDRESV